MHTSKNAHNALNFYQQSSEPVSIPKPNGKAKSITARAMTAEHITPVPVEVFSNDDAPVIVGSKGSKGSRGKVFTDSDEQYSIQSLSGAIRQKLFNENEITSQGALSGVQ